MSKYKFSQDKCDLVKWMGNRVYWKIILFNILFAYVPNVCDWVRVNKRKKTKFKSEARNRIWNGPEDNTDPFISEKKTSCSDYGVHAIQIDRLGLAVSTQKSVLKNLHRVQRYRPKCVKFYWFGLEGLFKLKSGQGRWHPITDKFIFLKST